MCLRWLQNGSGLRKVEEGPTQHGEAETGLRRRIVYKMIASGKHYSFSKTEGTTQ
jgi:hypothetical protein